MTDMKMRLPVKLVGTVAPGDSPREALAALKNHGVVVLVTDGRPAGVLTYSDMGRLREMTSGPSLPKRAVELFPAGQQVFSVDESDNPVSVARAIRRHGLKTGIVAVGRDQTMAGFVFNRDLKGLSSQLSEKVADTNRELRMLREVSPDMYSKLEAAFARDESE